MSDAAKSMPVLMPHRDRTAPCWEGCPRSVPWAVVEGHENQALANHSQTLDRLAERGGLSPNELYAVVHDRSFRQHPLAQPELLAWLKSVSEATPGANLDEAPVEPLFTYVYRGEGDPRDTADLREKIRGERFFFGKYPPSGPMEEWPLLAAMLVIMDWLDAELAEERAKLDLETARAVLDEAMDGRPDFEGFVERLEGEAKWRLDLHADDDAAGRTQAKSDADALTRLAERVRATGRSGGYL